MYREHNLKFYFKSIILTIFVFHSSIDLTGKEIIERIDSAYNFCLENPSDHDALDRFRSSLNRIYSSRPDTTFFYSSELLRLASEHDLKSMKGRALVNMGICMEYLGELDSAIYYYSLADETPQQTIDSNLQASVYNNLGIAYSYKGLFESSLEYTLKALAIHEASNNRGGMAMMYNNIGLRYSELANNTEAIRFYHRAIAINKELENTHRLGLNYNNLGRSYYIKNVLDSAEYYYQNGLKYCKLAGSEYSQSTSFNGLSSVAIKHGKMDLAILYSDSAYALSEKIQDELGMNDANFTKGRIYSLQGEHEKALQIFRENERWIVKNNYGSGQPDLYSAMAESYLSLGDFKMAYNYMELFANAKDSFLLKQKDLALEQISLYKQEKLNQEKDLLNQEIAIQENSISHQKTLRNTLIIIGILLVLIILGIANRFMAERKVKEALAAKNIIIEKEKERSESLLLNILPEEVAEELKVNGESEAKDFDDVTVVFTDFVGFTEMAEKLSAHDLVNELNHCFKAFDNIISKYNLEKIKTIGDSYMAASGLHLPRKAGAKEAVQAAIEMQDFMMEHFKLQEKAGKQSFSMRVGVHTGPVVAGIVGVKKFQYDIWGDTVNTASRMETNGEIGKVNLSDTTFQLIKDEQDFHFEDRGNHNVKGKGPMRMWFVSDSKIV